MTIRESYVFGWVYGLISQALNEDTRPDLAAPTPYSSLAEIFKKARQKEVLSAELEKQIAEALLEINNSEPYLKTNNETCQPLEYQGRWLIGYFRGLHGIALLKEQLNIKEMREERGLSQRELAKQIGVSSTVLSKWEKGKSKPSPKSLDKLREVLY